MSSYFFAGLPYGRHFLSILAGTLIRALGLGSSKDLYKHIYIYISIYVHTHKGLGFRSFWGLLEKNARITSRGSVT